MTPDETRALIRAINRDLAAKRSERRVVAIEQFIASTRPAPKRASALAMALEIVAAGVCGTILGWILLGMPV
jgi:F0F1-type ATP synthase assembly protein I